VEVVPHDHRTAVENAVENAIIAVSAVHKAAHAEDAPAMGTHLKEFDDANQQLEQQMKKYRNDNKSL